MSLVEFILVIKENPIVVLALAGVVLGIFWGFSVVFREFFTGKYSRAPQGSVGKKAAVIGIGILAGCVLLIVLPLYPRLIIVLSAVLAAAYHLMLSSKFLARSQSESSLPRKKDSKWTLAVGAVVVIFFLGILAYEMVFSR